jgi:hypothetical protein
MEISVNKIHGAISELKTARSNIRTMLAEAIDCTSQQHKRSLEVLNKSFSEIESTLFCLIEKKTHRIHQTLQV